MEKLMNRTQMKAIDSYSIHKVGIPSLVLMENAANQTARIIAEHITLEDIILVVCGTGNNGGDGLAAARILANRGYQVDVFLAGDSDTFSEEAKQQLKILENLETVIWTTLKEVNFQNYTVLVDALFGIGLDRTIEGELISVIEKINEQSCFCVALDMPSGVCADKGKVFGAAVKADLTITFGHPKIGQVLYPGNTFTGKLEVADIGLPLLASESVESIYFSYDRSDLKHLPMRQAHSHKGTFGRVLVIAGSENMSGAAYLSAKAAYRSGAGLVEILTAQANRTILQTQIPEAILTTYDPDHLDDPTEKAKIRKAVSEADSVVIGPGIGTAKPAHQLLDVATLYLEVPAVVDADAITIAADYYNTFPLMRNHPYVRLNEFSLSLPPHSIITPHLKELACLMDQKVEEIADDLLKIADLCAKDSELIYAIKGERTIVSHETNRYINRSGNSGMATAGAGDVLTGIIAGLLAQGTDPFEAAKLGVYIHGLAGDHAAQQKSEYGMIASDIIDSLSFVLQK